MNRFTRFLYMIGLVIKAMPAILLVLIIHEHGHYSEMKRYGVEVKEFSIGIGMPIFQHTLENGVLVSLRIIPISAYVMPSQNGVEKIKTLNFIEYLNICSAGVRNNIFTGWALVFIMQFISVSRLRDLPYFFKDLLFSPIRILILFFGFTVAFFHRWGTELVEKYQFVIYDVYENEHLNRILWWSFVVGFLNFLPLSGLDGAKIFFVPILATVNNLSIKTWLSFLSFYLFVFVFIRGIRIKELVDYVN